MKLHGVIISPNVRKVIIGCLIKNIEFEINNLIPGPDLKNPEFLKINPLGQIPALEDNDLIISDSNVILQYLDEKYPDSPLLPESPAERAKCRWLAEYAGAALFPCCGTMFKELFLNPNFFKQPTNKEKVEITVTEQFPTVLDYLELQIPEEGFLFGDNLTIADISIVSMFITAGYGGYSIDKEARPKLATYISLMGAVPEVVKCMENEKEMIKTIAS